MKDQQDTSIAVRNPVLEQSTTRPCKSSLGAKAMECSRQSRCPHSVVIRSKIVSSCPSTRTSSGINSDALSCRASGSTWGLALSLRYVIATSAPRRESAWAHPQAIDWSFAIPVISALRPARETGLAICMVVAPYRCPSSMPRFSSVTAIPAELSANALAVALHDDAWLVRSDAFPHQIQG